MDFNEIRTPTSDQRVRAWCIDKALEHGRDKYLHGEDVVHIAKMIEDYVNTGDVSGTIATAVQEGRIEGRFEVKSEVEEWYSNISLDDLFQVKGWTSQTEQP